MVTVIGGTNIDIQGYPARVLSLHDSNPGSVRLGAGGVARNVAENLARLGLSVGLLSAFGDDGFAQSILAELHGLGIDTSPSLVLRGGRTSIYLCIMDEAGGLLAAVSDMEGVERIDPLWIDRNAEILRGSELCVVDANLPEKTIDHLVRSFPDLPFVLDAVSAAKAVRARTHVGRFVAVKPNLREAEVLTGRAIESDGDLDRAAALMHEAGTRLVFISLGERGLYYSGGEAHGIVAAPARTIASTNGAGDAATAGIAFGLVRGYPVETIARLAAAAASLGAEVGESVNHSMTAPLLEAHAAEVAIERR